MSLLHFYDLRYLEFGMDVGNGSSRREMIRAHNINKINSVYQRLRFLLIYCSLADTALASIK